MKPSISDARRRTSYGFSYTRRLASLRFGWRCGAKRFRWQACTRAVVWARCARPAPFGYSSRVTGERAELELEHERGEAVVLQLQRQADDELWNREKEMMLLCCVK
jgi:hypothetical protein